MKAIKKIGMVAGIALVAFALASCGKKSAKSDKEESEALYAVNTYKVKAGNMDNYLEFGGDVVSASSVAVLPEVNGKVSRILVSIGQMVKKDQTIAYVDPSVPGFTYSASPVRAPISGRVISFIPTIGAMVGPGTVVAQIADTDELEVKVGIPERFVSHISKGQQAQVTFDAYPSEEFTARVFEVSPVLDATSRTMSIKMRFVKPDEKIKVGMYARIRLVTERIKDAVVAPSNAIVMRDGKPYIFVVSSRGTPSKVKIVPAKLGLTVDNKTEIVEGISAGDEIVVKGQNLLNDGASVNIISTSED